VGGTALNWFPDSGAFIWAAHLDVPDGVAITSRLPVFAGIGAPCPPNLDGRIFGALPLPIVRQLVPAGVNQYHLGADLGAGTSGQPANARISVGVYNAGSSEGRASIELRKGCDDLLIDSRSITVPANSLIQVSGLQTTFTSCQSPQVSEPNAPAFSSVYVVVRIDQPSFSYAITASNELPPKIPVGVSFTQ
jgi:hypothetical protein